MPRSREPDTLTSTTSRAPRNSRRSEKAGSADKGYPSVFVDRRRRAGSRHRQRIRPQGHSRCLDRPCSVRRALARVKGREPKKPLWAESGLGWADSTRGDVAEERLEVAGVAAPEDRGERAAAGGEGADGLLGDRLPAAALVGVGAARADGEGAVEQQDAAVGPRREVAGGRRRDGRGRGVLGEDVAQAGGEGPDVGGDGEAQADGVAGRRVRVLADDQDADVRRADAGRRAGCARPRGGSRGRRPPPRAGSGRARRAGPRRAPSACAQPGSMVSASVTRGRSPGRRAGPGASACAGPSRARACSPSETAWPIDSTRGRAVDGEPVAAGPAGLELASGGR